MHHRRGGLAGQFLVHHGMETDRHAPFDRDLELAVIDGRTTRLIAFPCRRVTDTSWLDVETNKRVYYIRPTHWRDWAPN
jgi:hypothetical protein